MDVISYALAKKIAGHAVSGVNSMSINGQTLIINTKDSGVLTMTFPTPKDGVSVTDIDVNANNQIVFTMSDGSEFISGKIPTVKGEKGDAGFSPTITENADNTDKIYKLDIETIDGIFTTPNLKGADGQGGGKGSITASDTLDTGEAAPRDADTLGGTVTAETINTLTDNLTASDSTKFRFATDGEGNYGYLKADDSFVPFKSGKEYSITDASGNELVNITSAGASCTATNGIAATSSNVYIHTDMNCNIILSESANSGDCGSVGTLYVNKESKLTCSRSQGSQTINLDLHDGDVLYCTTFFGNSIFNHSASFSFKNIKMLNT